MKIRQFKEGNKARMTLFLDNPVFMFTEGEDTISR